MNYHNLDKVKEICDKITELKKTREGLEDDQLSVRIYKGSFHMKTTGIWEHSLHDYVQETATYVAELKTAIDNDLKKLHAELYPL